MGVCVRFVCFVSSSGQVLESSSGRASFLSFVQTSDRWDDDAVRFYELSLQYQAAVISLSAKEAARLNTEDINSRRTKVARLLITVELLNFALMFCPDCVVTQANFAAIHRDEWLFEREHQAANPRRHH